MDEEEKESYVKMVLESEVPLKAMPPFEKNDVRLSVFNDLSSVPSTSDSAIHGLSVLADAAFSIFTKSLGNFKPTLMSSKLTRAMTKNSVTLPHL